MLTEQFGEKNKIPVLDHGHVFVVDAMGSDERIEQVARLSYEGGRKRSDTRGLIRYLMRHRHTSPFEQAVITLDIKLPIFVARQLVRHRTQSLNEVSARYTELPAEHYTPQRGQICAQATTNKQGRAEPVSAEDDSRFAMGIDRVSEAAFSQYQHMLSRGVARETARLVLPVNAYTHWVTTWDLHNLLHMLELRLHPHAQWEVRQYAEAIYRIVREWVPLTAEAFADYRLGAHTFSRGEMKYLRDLLAGEARDDGDLGSKREREAFWAALGPVRLAIRDPLFEALATGRAYWSPWAASAPGAHGQELVCPGRSLNDAVTWLEPHVEEGQAFELVIYRHAILCRRCTRAPQGPPCACGDVDAHGWHDPIMSYRERQTFRVTDLRRQVESGEIAWEGN